MKIVKYILYCITLFWVACYSSASAFCMNKVNAKSNMPNANPIANADSLFLFEYSNDTISQRLQFTFLDDSKIEFKLTSENKVRNKTVVKQGIAVNEYKNFGASETDEDETGSLYPVVEYIYRKECWLAFRFDIKYMRLRIKEADNEGAVSCCPLKSVGMLRLTKINSKSVVTNSLKRVFVDETTSSD